MKKAFLEICQDIKNVLFKIIKSKPLRLVKPKNRSKIVFSLAYFVGAILFFLSCYGAIGIFHYGMWVLAWDKYPVPTMSMYPTIIPEDHIVTHKYIFGARIYKNFTLHGSYDVLESLRLPGVRGIRRDEVVVFNAPFGRGWGEINFNISLVYCKRCVGLPGDTLSIVNGFYINHLGDTVGYMPAMRQLSHTKERFIDSTIFKTLPFDTVHYRWNIKNFGPLCIPQKNVDINLDTFNYQIYRTVIEYETGDSLRKREGKLILGDSVINKYCFKDNYYFMAGDNIMMSHDSRYFGFVPEEFIVGVVPYVFYHKNRKTGEIKWDRTFKRLNKTKL